MRADREVGDHADAHAGPLGRLLRRAELLRRQPLQPLVERDPVGQLPPELGDLGRARVGQSRGPGPPVRPVHLGDGAPRRPVSDSPAVTGEERVQFSPAARGQRHRADQLGRGALGGPDRVPVDQRRGAAGRPQRRGQRLHPGPVPGTQPLVFGDVLDPQVERADLAAAHRQVRGRADRRLRLGRVQRVDQHEVRAQVTTAPGGEVGQVVQVTVAPGGARAHRVQLHREAPAPASRERRHRRAHRAGPVGRHPVFSQGREDRGQRLVRHLDVPAAPVLVGDRHPVRLCPPRELCPSCHRTSLPDRRSAFDQDPTERRSSQS